MIFLSITVYNMEKEKLKKIIIDQREEIKYLKERTRLIERSCTKDYLQYIDSNQIKVIMGIRRCG